MRAGVKRPRYSASSTRRTCLSSFTSVSGRHASEELLERIFARFCIGK